MNKVIAVVVFVLCLSKLAYADGVNFNSGLSEKLKAYGLSYCLSYSSDTVLKNQAILSMTSYKKSANIYHYTYRVENFIDNELMNDKSYYKESNQRSVLMQCMTIYQSKSYNDLINKQLLGLK